MAIRGHAWKTTHEKNATVCFYRMQVNGISGAREENRVIKAMDGWVDAGEGYNAQTGLTTLYFRRDFGSVENFIKWGKGFQAFPIDEVDQDGKVKKYVKIGPRGSSGRVCGKCGGSGHNSRTCGKKRSQTPSKKGTRKCGKCGEQGHNSRTCKAANGISHNAVIATDAVNKLASKGKYKCGHCGEVGHNRRRCPNK